jgi:hypothetical protein
MLPLRRRMLMKTTIKISVLAIVAALVAFSCAQEPELSKVKWNDVNTKYNPDKNSNYYTFMGWVRNDLSVFDSELVTGANEANEVTISFHRNSDFLRTVGESQIEAGMKQFLSFHHFTKSENPVTGVPNAGQADVLGAALDYKLVRRNANVVTVSLTKTFAVTDSNVVMKVDGTKYTFAGGNKFDLVGRGVTGTAGYDDVYEELTVHTVTGPSGFTEPGNQDWELNLGEIYEYPSETIEATEYVIATLNFGQPDGSPADISAMIKAVADQLKGGLKIQEFSNGSWGNVNATVDFIEFEDVDYYGNSSIYAIFYTKLTLKDGVPIRVMWEGSGPAITAAEYFGVKQYIAIRGENTSGITGLNPALYRTNKVYGPHFIWHKEGGRAYDADTYIQDIIVSRDFWKKNVVFEVVFSPVVETIYPDDDDEDGEITTYDHWLKSITTEKQKFKDNFKIAYYYDPFDSKFYPPNAEQFADRPDVRYITVQDVETFTYNPGNDKSLVGKLNAIRFTLDPAYEDIRKIYFYVGPEIVYADDKTSFGDPANFTQGFFKAYEADGFDDEVPPGMLIANVWKDGEFTSADSEDWYYFYAEQGKQYYIRANAANSGNGTKTNSYVSLAVRYEGADSWIAGGDVWNYSSTWSSPIYFTATKSGYVEVRAIPVGRSSNGYNIGTYGIVYSTSSVRPPLGIRIASDEWIEGEFTSGNDVHVYYFPATPLTYYYIWLDNIYGSGGYTGNVSVRVSTPYYESYNDYGPWYNTYANPQAVQAYGYNGFAELVVRPSNNSDDNIGTYRIAFSDYYYFAP